MPTRRTPKVRNTRSSITPRAVYLFRLLIEIEDAEDDKFWEEDGGRQREYCDARVELHHLLGRDPAQVNVMDALDGEPPDYCDKFHDYPGAHALRVALEEYL
jgi:hypothetical protein